MVNHGIKLFSTICFSFTIFLTVSHLLMNSFWNFSRAHYSEAGGLDFWVGLERLPLFYIHFRHLKTSFLVTLREKTVHPQTTIRSLRVVRKYHSFPFYCTNNKHFCSDMVNITTRTTTNHQQRHDLYGYNHNNYTNLCTTQRFPLFSSENDRKGQGSMITREPGGWRRFGGRGKIQFIGRVNAWSWRKTKWSNNNPGNNE